MTDLFVQDPSDPKPKIRLVILADWLPPDFGAVGQYMHLRARALAERGHDVTLIGLTSANGSVAHRAADQERLTEIRLHTKPVPRTSLAGRLAWTFGRIWLVAVAFRHLRKATTSCLPVLRRF